MAAKANDSLASACPVCDSQNIHPFLEVPRMPVHVNVLQASRDEAMDVPRGDILLTFCENCGHVFNLVFDPGLTSYTGNYENSLHFSPRFQRYAEQLANRLVRRYRMRDRSIIEIGCGNGDFL